MLLYEILAWQKHKDRLREADRSRLARKTQIGHKRHSRWLSRVRTRSEGHLSLPETVQQSSLRRMAEEAAKVSRRGGGLIL
jgi:hypothetical protein